MAGAPPAPPPISYEFGSGSGWSDEQLRRLHAKTQVDDDWTTNLLDDVPQFGEEIQKRT